MTQKRKAEIQRKLSMRHIPAPPEDLAERIKGDIPKYLLDPQRERERVSRSMALSLRVAAAILLLCTSAYVMIDVLSLDEAPRELARATAPSSTWEAIAKKQVAAAPPRMPAAQTAAAPAMDEVRVEMTEAAPQAPPQPEQPAPRRREAVLQMAEGESGGIMAAPAAPPPPPALVPEPVPSPGTITITAQAPAVVGSVAAAQAPAERNANDFAREETKNAAAPRASASSSSLVREAQAAEFSLAPKTSVFGISVERDAFYRVKRAIENGERPAAGSVNVEALVNYFAGPAKKAPKDVRLEIEGSPAPVVMSGGHNAILRFTIDTAQAEASPTSSIPPIATDAHIDIELDANAVASYRRVGAERSTLASENTLLKNVSVTGLYELELQPRVQPRQLVARVRLRYRSIADGKQHELVRTLRVSDFAKSWMAASPRHRLASLGAVWGETLRNSTAGTDVARKAEELATKQPRDEKAKELADVASATSKL
ncbi:MAG TPA: von Willebrand factor type A domain-containing protein [Thermoanaerobaculia bacterium]|jgi:hypothetical protein